MLITLRTGEDFYLDGLIIETILSTFTAKDLALLSQVCHSLRAPAQLSAHRTLVGVVPVSYTHLTLPTICSV